MNWKTGTDIESTARYKTGSCWGLRNKGSAWCPGDLEGGTGNGVWEGGQRRGYTYIYSLHFIVQQEATHSM